MIKGIFGGENLVVPAYVLMRMYAPHPYFNQYLLKVVVGAEYVFICWPIYICIILDTGPVPQNRIIELAG